MRALELLLLFIPVIGLLGYFAVQLAKVITRRNVPLEIEAKSDPRVDVLEREVAEIKEELLDARDRLAFTEQLLAKKPDAKQIGPS
jgi:hypothetical protein